MKRVASITGEESTICGALLAIRLGGDSELSSTSVALVSEDVEASVVETEVVEAVEVVEEEVAVVDEVGVGVVVGMGVVVRVGVRFVVVGTESVDVLCTTLVEDTGGGMVVASKCSYWFLSVYVNKEKHHFIAGMFRRGLPMHVRGIHNLSGMWQPIIPKMPSVITLVQQCEQCKAPYIYTALHSYLS